MPNNYVPRLVPQGDEESVRRQITQALNQIAQQVANSDTRSAPMNMSGNRVTQVADPGNPTDAVNLRYLKKKLDDITQLPQRRSPGRLYSMVFSNSSTPIAGAAACPYTINKGQAGAPTLASIACQGTGTGVSQFNVAQNGTNVLTSDIVLPASSTGPIVVNNFISGTVFRVGDLITPVVTVIGGASFIDLQVQVLPNGT